MACNLDTILAALCDSDIGKLDNKIKLLQIIAELTCEAADAAGGGGGSAAGPLNAVQFNAPLGTFAGSSDLTFDDVTDILSVAGSVSSPLFTGALTGNVTGSSSLNVLKAGDTMTGLLTIAQGTANTTALAVSGYSLTGANAQSMVSLAGTWNTSGNPVGIRLTITNTASGATAKLLEFFGGAAGATSLFAIGASDGSIYGPSADTFRIRPGASQNVAFIMSAATSVSSNVGFFISNDSSTLSFGGSADVILQRDGAADTLALRRTTNAQAFRVYRTWTNSTNYERLALQTAAGQMILAAETAGTGTDDLDLVLTAAGVGRVTLQGGANLLKTTAAMTSGAGASAGTLGNAPSIGNPAVWCPIMFNGVQHWFPCWT